MLTLLIAATLIAAALGCGVMLGGHIIRTTIRDEVIREKARLEADRAEVQRLVLGQTQGFLDGRGQLIKLHSPSALRQMPDRELEEIAKDRGLFTMQSLGDRNALLAAIQDHQKAFSRAHHAEDTLISGRPDRRSSDERRQGA